MPSPGAGTSASTLSVETSTSVSPSSKPLALLLVPLEHGALGDRLAHLGHRQSGPTRLRGIAGDAASPWLRTVSTAVSSPRSWSPSPPPSARRQPRRQTPRVSLLPSRGQLSPGSSSARTSPTLTSSSGCFRTFVIVPLTGAGTSASTLSVETSTIGLALLDEIALVSCATRARCPRSPIRPSGASRADLLLGRHSPRAYGLAEVCVDDFANRPGPARVRAISRRRNQLAPGWTQARRLATRRRRGTIGSCRPAAGDPSRPPHCGKGEETAARSAARSSRRSPSGVRGGTHVGSAPATGDRDSRPARGARQARRGRFLRFDPRTVPLDSRGRVEATLLD